MARLSDTLDGIFGFIRAARDNWDTQFSKDFCKIWDLQSVKYYGLQNDYDLGISYSIEHDPIRGLFYRLNECSLEENLNKHSTGKSLAESRLAMLYPDYCRDLNYGPDCRIMMNLVKSGPNWSGSAYEPYHTTLNSTIPFKKYAETIIRENEYVCPESKFLEIVLPRSFTKINLPEGSHKRPTRDIFKLYRDMLKMQRLLKIPFKNEIGQIQYMNNLKRKELKKKIKI